MCATLCTLSLPCLANPAARVLLLAKLFIFSNSAKSALADLISSSLNPRTPIVAVPELDGFRGLSGLDSALFVLFYVQQIRRSIGRDPLVTGAVAANPELSIVLEMTVGRQPDQSVAETVAWEQSVIEQSTQVLQAILQDLDPGTTNPDPTKLQPATPRR